jgi:rod shape-determining protein MreB
MSFSIKLQNIVKKIKRQVNDYTDYDDLIGIDFGTSKIIICNQTNKVKLIESSKVAFLDENGIRVPYLFGDKAKDMTGKTPLKIEVCSPIKRGVVYDFEMTEEMIKNFLSQASKDNFFIKPKAIVAIPLETSPSEKKLIQETLEKCGIKETLLIYKNMADAIGCELPINKPVGFMIVDIGEGTTDISVISLGGIVIGKSIQVAGAQMTKDIVEYIKNKYGILIADNITLLIPLNRGRKWRFR